MDSKGCIFCYSHLVSIYLRTFFPFHLMSLANCIQFYVVIFFSYTYKVKQFPYTTWLYELLFFWHIYFCFNYMSIPLCSHVNFSLSVNISVRLLLKQYFIYQYIKKFVSIYIEKYTYMCVYVYIYVLVCI